MRRSGRPLTALNRPGATLARYRTVGILLVPKGGVGEGTMNHLEQLVAEWLQYNGYFVRVAVQVGARPMGGFEGELDVVGIHLADNHLIHVECSLDADSWAKRQEKFKGKFDRGRRFIKDVFKGFPIPEVPDQVVVLQFASGNVRDVGGGRLVLVRELIHEIFDGLKGTSPVSGAVPSNLPLLRTLQLAADASRGSLTDHRLITRDGRAEGQPTQRQAEDVI